MESVRVTRRRSSRSRSQVSGELRELRVRFADRRYRILYQRSGSLLVLLHASETTTGSIAHSDIELAK